MGSLLLQVVFLISLFEPGFLAPDLVLISLLVIAYTHGREALLWAMVFGAFLDMLTDNLGLNLAMETLSIYLFLLLHEKLLLKNALTFLVVGSAVVFLKRSLTYILFRFKFSFDMSWADFFLAWLTEVLLLTGVYFLYLKRRE